MSLAFRTLCAILIFTPIVFADEATEPTGKKHRGELVQEKGVWTFRTNTGASLPFDELAHVRFDAKPIPLPRAPAHAVLVLAGEERLSGTLLKVDANEVSFVPWLGKPVALS